MIPFIECQVSSMNIIVSFANWRWKMFTEDPNWTPIMIPSEKAFMSSSCNTCVVMMNKRGEIGSPYRNPLSMLNSFEGLPFISTDCLVEETIEWIQDLHFIRKPMCWRVPRRNTQLTVSKAFSKSSLSIRPFVYLFLDTMNHLVCYHNWVCNDVLWQTLIDVQLWFLEGQFLVC